MVDFTPYKCISNRYENGVSESSEQNFHPPMMNCDVTMSIWRHSNPSNRKRGIIYPTVVLAKSHLVVGWMWQLCFPHYHWITWASDQVRY